MENFLQLVEAGYSANSYHNNVHATDVTQTAAIILEALAKQVDDIPKMDVFCIIMASAVHDLGHLGVNNDFLINSRHPRATTYNDKSVNENYHVARAFELARTNKGCDIFELFTFDEQKKVCWLFAVISGRSISPGGRSVGCFGYACNEVLRLCLFTRPKTAPLPSLPPPRVCAVSAVDDRRGAGHGYGHPL